MEIGEVAGETRRNRFDQPRVEAEGSSEESGSASLRLAAHMEEPVGVLIVDERPSRTALASSGGS